MSTQVLISPALVALHNFIQQYDPQEIHDYDGQLLDFEMDHHPDCFGRLRMNVVMPNEVAQANER
jgi:hypothetical protein